MTSDGISPLLAEMKEAGWVLVPTANGHVQAKAPDGVTIIHLPGKDGGGRSLANTRAMFDRWVADRDARAPGAVLVPNVCDQCGESFPTAVGLGAHRRMHKTKMATCPVCGQRFRATGMGRHLNVHKTTVPESSHRETPDGDSLAAVAEDLLTLAARVERLSQTEDGLRQRLRRLLDEQ